MDNLKINLPDSLVEVELLNQSLILAVQVNLQEVYSGIKQLQTHQVDYLDLSHNKIKALDYLEQHNHKTKRLVYSHKIKALDYLELSHNLNNHLELHKHKPDYLELNRKHKIEDYLEILNLNLSLNLVDVLVAFHNNLACLNNNQIKHNNNCRIPQNSNSIILKVYGQQKWYPNLVSPKQENK